jgi:hypothetical protein
MLSGAAITRIEFSGGHVDNFFFQAQSVQPAFQINQDTDTITVTPPSGFVGWMAIRVAVVQTGSQPDTVSPEDSQVIRIRVNPTGTSAAIADNGDDDGEVDEDAVDEVFDELGAT